jgi:hypothetical protein
MEVGVRCGARPLAALVAVTIIGVASTICTSAVAAVRGCQDGRITFDSLGGFDSPPSGDRNIYVMNPFAGGSGPPAPDPHPVRLTTGADDEKPSWSPPAVNLIQPCKDPSNPPKMVAFQRTIDGSTNIYAVDVTQPEPGVPAQQITYGGDDTAPAWAPFTPKGDVQLTYPPIAFERNVNGRRDIFVTHVDGSEETNLTNTPGGRSESGLGDGWGQRRRA